jgi:hypothetical protein
VLKVLELQEPTEAAMKQDWDKAKQAMVQQKQQEFENLYVESLKNTLEKSGKIKINQKEMERITSLASS